MQDARREGRDVVYASLDASNPVFPRTRLDGNVECGVRSAESDVIFMENDESDVILMENVECPTIYLSMFFLSYSSIIAGGATHTFLNLTTFLWFSR